MPAGVPGVAAQAAPTSIFAPASAPAEMILDAGVVVLAVAAAIFLVVGGLLAFAIVRFRRRPDDDGSEPPQVYGSEPIELAWTVAPLLVVIALVLVTTRTIWAVQGAPRPVGALDVTLVGHQWWWEVRYPGLDVVTANEIHVPVSHPAARRPTILALESADVIHSVWVPRLAGKTDLIPNRHNVTWIEPWTPGVYLGQCAEYCGTQHAKMLLRVVVHEPDDFARWVAAQRAPAVADPAARAGRALFEATACVSCHTVRGTGAAGRFGPDLTHLMSRDTIASGAAPNTPDALRAWITDPDHLKPGALMPAMRLAPDEVDRLVGYLVTLR